MKCIDLNSDMGELPELLADGTQERIMAAVSSVNVACGAHAGDDATIASTLASAKKYGLAVGAHPGYPDRENFGRKVLSLKGSALEDSIFQQLETLAKLAKQADVPLSHVKPHGALYHEISRGEAAAEFFLQAVANFNRELIIVGFAGSRGLKLAAARGFSVAAEAFMDRAYELDGTLRARGAPGAVVTEPELALKQALAIIQLGKVTSADGTVIPVAAETLCVHSDTPGSAQLAADVAARLQAAGISVRSLHQR